LSMMMINGTQQAVALRGSVALASQGDGKWDETDNAARAFRYQ
jgi:hypothetical protein